MGVIVELSLPADEFELGRILSVEDTTSLVLETMVPLGERPIPFVRFRDSDRSSFEESVRVHPAVNRLQEVATYDDETLYALDWEMSDETFLSGVLRMNAHLLDARGGAKVWTVELRFPSHDSLSAFQEYCADAEIHFDVNRIYNPAPPDADSEFGLSAPQREALSRAVETGYYAIPRQISTKELADEFDISDQALTERLRRGIDTLVTNTLHRDKET
ncbi:helix-turn-helix domain-containing protein [Haloarcula sp. JP-L23]|uniref:helix-turn-helix domain-containing protein n=1 Tax=Haloarcula sp. JP-L23 TaxID=2716717 RepID=UPI00140EF2E6|nr:helix-turn-helix domain-containing protein [Haloarcula sp. JP-L23]